jgi:hypothetical protein
MTKPADFFIGVLDFFSILLPGSMTTWLVTRYLTADDLRDSLAIREGGGEPSTTVLWIAFLVASYTLGHFVFMIGARLDPLYDRWRERTKPASRDRAFQAAKRLRDQVTPGLTDGEFSVLKWAKVYILLGDTGARAEIDRLEADSKFFRSLIVVSALLSAHFLLHERAPGLGLAALAMAALSYGRFREQRWKLTELSYATAVLVGAMSGKTKAASGPPGGSADE